MAKMTLYAFFSGDTLCQFARFFEKHQTSTSILEEYSARGYRIDKEADITDSIEMAIRFRELMRKSRVKPALYSSTYIVLAVLTNTQ